MKLALTLLLLTCTFSTRATTFIVTTNADSGPGSLRDAITQAAANGTATPDLIVFNIADLSRTGRTITLASALPDLTSNLTIDGTTQPGTPFGISDARVIITNSVALTDLYYFTMIGVSDIQLYGLFLQGVLAGYGFYFRNATNLVFGGPGKGNILQGFATAIESDHILNSDPGSSNITIQGNIMGTDESGMSASPNELNSNGIVVLNVTNLQIGGLAAGQGNLMNETSFPLTYTDTYNADFGYLNIEGNKEGVDITGSVRLSPNYEGMSINGYNTGEGNTTGTTALLVNIINNVSVGGYQLFDIASPFVIQGNHIGVGLDNATNLIAGAMYGISCDIFIEMCGQGLIGGSGPGQKNYLAYNGSGVYEFMYGAITISQNSIFCNSIGINLGSQYSPTHPASFVNITLLTAGSVGGTALPNSIIELFYDDECPGCEGKTYIGMTTADNNGNWSYSLTPTGAIVATATDSYGSTSAFSTATINTDKIVVQNATCGRNNGSIKNIEVTSGTEWYWQDAAGNILAHSVDLTNVGPGTYTFVTSIGGAACNASSTPYTITNISLPAFDPSTILVTQPSCGQNSGALSYSGTFDPSVTYSWLNGSTILSPDFSVANPLQGLAPGSYTLQLALTQDPTCLAQYGPYTLANQSGPSLITTNAQITASTCSKSNGALSGITYQNAIPPIYLAWQNDQGITVSNALDLQNISAGSYRLVFKDGGACDTLFSSWYAIPDNGTIRYDTSGMIITTASCEAPNGSITGISFTNASSFSWINISDGAVMGASPDLSGLAGGVYRLDMSNAYGCQTQTPGLTVPQIPKPAFDYTNLQVRDDTCKTASGSIRNLTMTDMARSYTWNWYRSENNTVSIATTAGHLDSLNAGVYLAVVTDSYSCTVTSNPLTVTDIEFTPPVPQVADQYIPRYTSTTIVVENPRYGLYQLLNGPAPGGTALDSSASGTLQTPVISEDETLYVGFIRGDCQSSLAPVNIKVFDSVRIFVPNAFTPNGDGTNDQWHIVIRGLLKKMQTRVFDRWGSLVFSSNDPNFSWDGSTGGQPRSGTFVYMIAGTDYYGKPFQLKGTLLIIR